MVRRVCLIALLAFCACTKREDANVPAAGRAEASVGREAVLGLTFGMSPAQARAVVEGSLTFDSEDVDGSLAELIFVGPFAGKTSEVRLQFFEEQLFQVFVALPGKQEEPLSLRWFEVLSSLERQHGEPDTFVLPVSLREEIVATIESAADTPGRPPPFRIALDMLAEADGAALDASVLDGTWAPHVEWRLVADRTIDGRILANAYDPEGNSPLVGGVMFTEDRLASKARAAAALD